DGCSMSATCQPESPTVGEAPAVAPLLGSGDGPDDLWLWPHPLIAAIPTAAMTAATVRRDPPGTAVSSRWTEALLRRGAKPGTGRSARDWRTPDSPTPDCRTPDCPAPDNERSPGYQTSSRLCAHLPRSRGRIRSGRAARRVARKKTPLRGQAAGSGPGPWRRRPG